jgi:prepilin-type N-terminal cleavage/methylation domain-containing protein
MQMIKKIFSRKGYTLIEILVAMSLFGTIMIIVGTSMANLYKIQRRQKALDSLYEESRFLAERVVKHIRNNTIDYSEYYLQARSLASRYGESPNDYENRFYSYVDAGGGTFKRYLNMGFFNTGADVSVANDNAADNALVDNYEQDELYLISGDGKTKTILKRMKNGIDDDESGGADDGSVNDTGLEYIFMGKMVTDDLDSDGVYDTWVAHPDYKTTDSQVDCAAAPYKIWLNLGANSHCMRFYSITPPLMEVKNLKFYISPLEDPRKAFAEDSKDIQIQPHVTIVLDTTLSSKKRIAMRGDLDSAISLQTTISSRVYNNVTFPPSF